MKPPAALVPLEEYLHSSFEHDCEYVDGVILERGMPLKPHAKIRRNLIAFFVSLEGTLKTDCFPKQRIQVRPTRVRIPDVCVYVGEEPGKVLFVTPPCLAVEIFSPDDRHERSHRAGPAPQTGRNSPQYRRTALRCASEILKRLMDKIRDCREFA
jgi:Uma2 family endonuclease